MKFYVFFPESYEISDQFIICLWHFTFLLLLLLLVFFSFCFEMLYFALNNYELLCFLGGGSFGSHVGSHVRGYEGGYTPLHILSNDSQMTTFLSIGRSMGESPYWPHLIGRSMGGESLSYFEAF